VRGEAEQVKKRSQWKPVGMLGLDGANVVGWGEKQSVPMAVDLGTGEPIALRYVNEYDSQAVRRWLEPLAQRTWWTNPLNLLDLQINSAHNTLHRSSYYTDC
jgi:hypothetical protein